MAEIWKDVRFRWLALTGVLVCFFEVLSLSGVEFPNFFSIPFFSVVILLIGHQTLLHGLQALFNLNFRSINLLMVIAVVGAFYLEEYAEAAVVIVLFNLAEHLEDIGIEKSQSSLDKLVEKMPKIAYLKGQEEPVKVSDISIGQVIVIKPFQMIPLDGVVTDGVSYVDEATITGEPLPKDKRAGDEVFAGTLNKSGHIEVKVTQTASTTAFAKIREMTFQAIQNQAETQKFIEKFSYYYTPGIIILALSWTFLPWLALGWPFEYGFSEALALLVIACPCALVISTPISIFSALGNASSNGVLIKGGKYLEALGQIKAMGFDKTRTLTYGEPKVTDVIPFGKHSREDLLSCAAGVELFSEHPLAQSIVDAAKGEGLTPHGVENFESIVGKGAKGDCLVCYDRHHCIGKLQFVLEEHHVPQEVLDRIKTLQNEGKTVIVVSTHNEVEGIIALEDALRPEAGGLVETLKKLGITSVMVTGDHKITAEAVAKKLGIADVRSEMLPADKAKAISDMLHKYGSVGMIGDGVNDAPALALANVGISMSTLGSDTALEAASVIILSNHLDTIPYLVQLGRKTLQIIKFNTAFAVLVKFIFIGLALGGMTNLAFAIFADVGVTLLVVLNSLRLMK